MDISKLLTPGQKDGLLQAYHQRVFYNTSLTDTGFTDAEFDDFFQYTSFREADVRIIKNGQAIPDTRYLVPGIEGPFIKRELNKDVVFNLFNEGYTLIFGKINDKGKQYSQLADSINQLINCDSWINAYITPAGSSGFDVHADDHDVIILQASGSKQWSLYPGDELFSITVEKNDLLFIPKGLRHKAETNETSSLHFTIGFAPYTYYAAYKDAVFAALSKYDNLIYPAEDDDKVTAEIILELNGILSAPAKEKGYHPPREYGMLQKTQLQLQIGNEDILCFIADVQVLLLHDSISLHALSATVLLPLHSMAVITQMKMRGKFNIAQLLTAADEAIVHETIHTLYKNGLIKKL